MLIAVVNVSEEILYVVANMSIGKNMEKESKKRNIHRHKRCITKTQSLTFASVMCALGIVILLIGSLVEVVDITMAAVSSFLIIVCMIELGGYMPFLVYCVTSVLGFLLLPNKSVMLIYILFFGFYPILKNYFERLSAIYSWIVKFVVFNAVVIFYYFILDKLFFLNADSVKSYLLVLLNVVFFTFDLTLTLFVTAYVRRLRRLFRIHKFFE